MNYIICSLPKNKTKTKSYLMSGKNACRSCDGVCIVEGDQLRAQWRQEIVVPTVSTEPESLPHTLTSLWSSSLLRPWGSAGSPRGDKKKDKRIMRKIMRRGKEERSPIPNYLVCSGRGQLQDWISLVTFKMGLFRMQASVFTNYHPKEKTHRKWREMRSKKRSLWQLGMMESCVAKRSQTVKEPIFSPDYTPHGILCHNKAP